MTLYDFRNIPQSHKLVDNGVTPSTKITMDHGVINEARVYAAKRKRLYDQTNTNITEETVYSLIPALYHVDIGIRDYFSNIEVPTDDGVRTNIPIRVAGGEKSTLYWKQQIRNEIRNGRITLPVMAVNRESSEFNPQKFSPAYMPISRRFEDTAGSRMRLAYRPYPVLVNYTLSLWTVRKRDIEYMLYQIMPRFNGGLAEFYAETEDMTGTIVMKLNTMTDNSDIEAEADSLAKVQYDISITAEGWIPLPQKIVPTVLGHVATMREQITGELLDIVDTRAVPIAIQTIDPTPR